MFANQFNSNWNQWKRRRWVLQGAENCLRSVSFEYSGESYLNNSHNWNLICLVVKYFLSFFARDRVKPSVQFVMSLQEIKPADFTLNHIKHQNGKKAKHTEEIKQYKHNPTRQMETERLFGWINYQIIA